MTSPNSPGSQRPTSVPAGVSLLRAAEVQARTNIGKTKRSELIRKGLFPAPIKVLYDADLPGRTSYWLSSAIDAWIAEQVAAHQAHLKKLGSDGLEGWLTRAVRKAQGDKGE